MKTTYSILALIGGIADTSINRELYRQAAMTLPACMELRSFPIATLPFFSQDLEANRPTPVEALKEAVQRADAILFVTPEYNRSYPGVLKNAIDWISRPRTENGWKDKPAGIMGVSTGFGGTIRAQSHLRDTLHHVDMRTMEEPEIGFVLSRDFDANGILSDGATEQIRLFWNAFLTHIDPTSNVQDLT